MYVVVGCYVKLGEFINMHTRKSYNYTTAPLVLIHPVRIELFNFFYIYISILGDHKFFKLNRNENNIIKYILSFKITIIFIKIFFFLDICYCLYYIL